MKQETIWFTCFALFTKTNATCWTTGGVNKRPVRETSGNQMI